MASNITGNASDVTTPLSRTVTGATNASPIVITTSADHLFATDDTVEVKSVGGNTAANGVWKIIKLSATTFSLTGSTGNAAYTSGGTVVDLALTPQFQIPDDGDPPTAASVNVAFDALADRVQYLALRGSPISSLTALKTVNTTGLAYGTQRYVTAQGIYELEDTGAGGPHGSAVDNFPWTVAPTTGPGVWRAAAQFLSTRTLVASLGGLTQISANAGAAASETRASYAGNRGIMAASHMTLSTGGATTRQVDTTAGKSYYYAMCIDEFLVDGGTLSSVALRYSPAAGHGGLPALFPGMRIDYHEPGTQTVGTLGAFAYDTAASVVAYEVYRTFTWTPSSNQLINKGTRSYYLVIGDEGGANALAGTTFAGATFSFTGIADARPQ